MTKSILRDVEKMLAEGKMDLPLSLGFAAEREDETLLRNLIRRGRHPDETDMNGRAALVCTLVFHSTLVSF